MKNSFKKIIPRALKKKLSEAYIEIFKKYHKGKFLRREKEIKAVELEEKHLKNLTALPNRLSLLEKLPKGGIVAEIGVDTGDFSEKILSINKPKKLHLIDVWGSQRYSQDKKIAVEEKFIIDIQAGNIEINLGYSTKMVTCFEDAYFDWIYIDTDHSYGTTRDELKLYAPKLKKGGIIAGHDYEVGHWNSLAKFGVIEAVHEFCVLYNWEFLYITMENRDHRSFAIRKM